MPNCLELPILNSEIKQALIQLGTWLAFIETKVLKKGEKMNSHWFVIASQSTVKIFVDASDKNRLTPIKILKSPLARAKTRDLAKKNSGLEATTPSGGHYSLYYSEPKRHNSHDEAATDFAKELVHHLEEEFEKHNYKTLTIVAEPHFLGKIRSAMDSKMLRLVNDWIRKDLEKTPQSQLPKHLFPKNKLMRIESVSPEILA